MQQNSISNPRSNRCRGSVRPTRLSMRLPNLGLAFVAVAALCTGCASRRGTWDLTAEQSSICGLHQVAMTRKRVHLAFGMMPHTYYQSPAYQAMVQTFPHGDQPYDIGTCIPPRQRYARVFVCPVCTEVRRLWLADNPQTTAKR